MPATAKHVALLPSLPRIATSDALTLALALAVLGAAYWGSLLAIADGNALLPLNAFSNNDIIGPWLLYRDAVINEAYPMDGYRAGVARFHFPDLLGMFALFAAGVPPLAAILIMPFLFAAISMGGWIAVCAHAYGYSAARCAFVILMHALPFMLLTSGPNDFHPHSLTVMAHYGTWVCVPWLLFYAMRALEQGRGDI